MPGKKKKRTLVVGLGTSGFAAALFLARRGNSVLVNDSADSEIIQYRATQLSKLGVEVILGSAELPNDIEQVVTSPGVSQDKLQIFRDKKIPVLGELEIGCREITVPLIAVTGTNGKSTVVTNIAKGLQNAGQRAVAIGNLGTPITEWVDRDESVDVVVVEVSSYQLETIVEFHPHIAIVLNVAPDHLGHHGSMEAYVGAKARITMNQTIEDVLILHRDLFQYPILQNTRGRLFWYGHNLSDSLDGLSLRENQLIWRGGGPEWTCPINPSGIYPHDIDNLMGCVAAQLFMGVSVDQAVRLFENPVRLPHRLELVAELNGVRYVNDSKATNAHAAIAALYATEGPLVWLVGGESKGEDLDELASAVSDRQIANIICFGKDRQRFYDLFVDNYHVSIASTLKEGVGLAKQIVRAGDTVLLAPACASFDEFKSFEDRGEKFRHWVLEQSGASSS
jgi:UDP-N-acetylmuramoylalanine--D-glutamate ligase